MDATPPPIEPLPARSAFEQAPERAHLSGLPGSPLPLDDRAGLQWLGHLQRLASTGLLAGGMAHDLAGLVQPLLAESERVLITGEDDDCREALVRVRGWARRCEEYVRALLDLVRRDEHHRTVVPVERVVEDTLLLLEAKQRSAGVSITRNLDNRHEALADRTRVMQAVLNVLTNAMRAASEGGHEVDVSVRGERGWILIEVTDNGPGIPSALRERLFQPFVHQSAPGRTGLGLYMSRRLIEEQGGRIEFDTEEGKGSTFRVMLEPAPNEGSVAGTHSKTVGNSQR
ncbi:MAG: HAMP domain-containing sensor histidine kinase [Planctomycetota bacterium]|nr:HAMP domain-containing sensor histidine kinase [Planctomycetota bacterium]